jgi:hypothetical protein
MHNASIHSVWCKQEESRHYGELLQLVKMNKPRECYELDTIVTQHGHTVVRLPPYHCHHNPSELKWAQVISYVADKNTTFRTAGMEKMTHEAVDKTQTACSMWKNCKRRILKQEFPAGTYHRKPRDSDSEESEFNDENVCIM